MGIVFPANTKKSKNVIKNLREELELRKLNCEWQEEVEGLFGLMKHNNKSQTIEFFESIIQAHIQKEAENIPLAAFEFWTDKHTKNLLEEEIKI